MGPGLGLENGTKLGRVSFHHSILFLTWAGKCLRPGLGFEHGLKVRGARPGEFSNWFCCSSGELMHRFTVKVSLFSTEFVIFVHDARLHFRSFSRSEVITRRALHTRKFLAIQNLNRLTI
jgi:hypothetical protein